MKTKPKAQMRTMTYYPEAVEVKVTVKYDGGGYGSDGDFEREEVKQRV